MYFPTSEEDAGAHGRSAARAAAQRRKIIWAAAQRRKQCDFWSATHQILTQKLRIAEPSGAITYFKIANCGAPKYFYLLTFLAI